MSGDIARRPIGVPINSSSRKEMRAIINATRVEQTAIRAIETVTTEAMYAAMRLKSVQTQLELALPAASADLSIIGSAGCMALARAVQQFGSDVS
jgi:hypothetical protein